MLATEEIVRASISEALPAWPAPAAITPVHQRPERAKTRHRFARDGGVPVETVTGSLGTAFAVPPLRGRIARRAMATGTAPVGHSAAPRADLHAERSARAGIERSLAETQATIRSLQATLAHTELAHAEAMAIERRAREAAERRLDEAAAARAGVEVPMPPSKAKRAKAVEPAPKPPAAKAREPKPVRWWLPDYKATTKAR